MTISSYHQKLKKGEITCEQMVKDCLGVIDEKDKKLNAFITICKDAVTQARGLDNEYRKDKNVIKRKPLFGVPVSIKDLFCTKGVRTTAASKVLENYIPVYDATSVARLKDAGAIIVGKNNCDAWAHGASGENSDFGPTKNPYDESLVPGGSSSGSAVSVASKMSMVAMGTDTGGSIRLPAAFCGVVGLKPTYGRVSRYGVVAMASSLDSIGHFTQTVEDSATVLGVTAGLDEKDATTASERVLDYKESLGRPTKGLRVAVPKEFFSKDLDRDIKEKTLDMIKKVERSGVIIGEVSIPSIEYAIAVYYVLVSAEISSNLARYDGIRYGQKRNFLGDEAKRRIMLGTYVLSHGYYDAYYLRAMKIRSLICNDFDKVFQKYDAILAPVSPTMPWRLGERLDDPLKMYLADIYVCMVNLAGLPAMSVPIGFSNNLPVGMQIIGPRFREDTIFQLGSFIEGIQ